MYCANACSSIHCTTLLCTVLHCYALHTTAGFKCPEHENPADFFLDVLIASVDVSEEDDTTDGAAVDKTETTEMKSSKIYNFIALA